MWINLEGIRQSEINESQKACLQAACLHLHGLSKVTKLLGAKQNSGAMGWREGEVGNSSMSVEFQSCKKLKGF